MSWATELTEALGRLASGPAGGGAGQRPQVSFTTGDSTVAEVGREFNLLAAELTSAPPGALTRELRHRLRNRLAGILAAVTVLRETGGCTPDEQAALEPLRAAAQRLDARLKAE